MSNGVKVKIIGAGSIGNHLAQASRRMGWNVVVVDNDPGALERMKKDIYPKRYGAWDPKIKLFKSGQEPRGGFDLIVIGTPPDSHMKLALEAIKEKPRLLHIEKPLCTPDLKGVDAFRREMKRHKKTIVTVGYDHGVAKSIEAVRDMLKRGLFGKILTIDVEFREHWRGIFNAHPWLAGPWASYLGHWRRGGGAGGEHSHALHLWLYFAHLLGWGEVSTVKSLFSMKREKGAEYDQLAAFLLATKKGNLGRVIQDVITHPVHKWARLQGDKGFIKWICNGVPEGDIVRYQVEEQEMVEKIFPKKRPDDFFREIMHYRDLMDGKISPKESPLSFERGLEVMKILQSAHQKK